MKCSCKDININILLLIFIMFTNGKWQPVYSLYEEKSSQQLSKKINHFQDSDMSRYLKMSNGQVHRIVKKQMKEVRSLDRFREKGAISKRKFVRNSDDSANTTLKMTRGRLFPDVFDSIKFQNSPPCTKIRNKRHIETDEAVAIISSDCFEPICPIKCSKESPGTQYMVKVLPMDKDGDGTDDDDDDDDEEDENPCGKCKKIKNKVHPFPVCSKCYYCFEGKPVKIKFLYSIACPGGKGLEQETSLTPPAPPSPAPAPANPPCQQKAAVKLPPFVCKPPQCRQVLYCKYFQCTSLGFFPDEKDCRKYFFCDLNNNGFQLYHMTCPNGRIFDEKLRECRLKDVMKKRDVERCWIEKDVEKLSDILKNKKKERNKGRVFKIKGDKLKFDIVLNQKKRAAGNPAQETSLERPTLKTKLPNFEKLVFDVDHPIPENVFTNPNYAKGSTYRLPIVMPTDQANAGQTNAGQTNAGQTNQANAQCCCEMICKPKNTKKCKKPKKPKPCNLCPKPKACPPPCCPPPEPPPKPSCPVPIPPPCCVPSPCPPPPPPPPKGPCSRPCPSRRKANNLHSSINRELVASLKNPEEEPANINWLPLDDITKFRQTRGRKCKRVGTFPDPFECDKYLECESTELDANLKGRPLKLIRRVCPPGLFFHKRDLKCRSKSDFSNKYLVRHCFRDLQMSNRRLKDKLGDLTRILTSDVLQENQ